MEKSGLNLVFIDNYLDLFKIISNPVTGLIKERTLKSFDID